MIPREILKKIRQIEIRTNRIVTETLAGDLSEIRMSPPVLEAVLGLRSFLFDAVYENDIATAEFKKAGGILGGLWEKVRENPKNGSRSAALGSLKVSGREALCAASRGAMIPPARAPTR